MNIDQLEGLTLVSVDGLAKDSEEVIFTSACGRRFRMFHTQDCCEHVRVDDVIGDVKDLIGQPIVNAYEETNEKEPIPKDSDYSFLWTFYRIATNAGTLTIKWLGESNGYYSESVDFVEIT